MSLLSLSRSLARQNLLQPLHGLANKRDVIRDLKNTCRRRQEHGRKPDIYSAMRQKGKDIKRGQKGEVPETTDP